MRIFIGLLLCGSLAITLGCTQPKSTTPTKVQPQPSRVSEGGPSVLGGANKGLSGGDEETTPPAKKDTAPTPPAKKDTAPTPPPKKG